MKITTRAEEISLGLNRYLERHEQERKDNLQWLNEQMNPYFLSLNHEEIDALALLTMSLHKLVYFQRLNLVDRDERLMVAQMAEAGSLYRVLKDLPERKLSYAEITTSLGNVPDSDKRLEVLRCDYDLVDDGTIAEGGSVDIPTETRSKIESLLAEQYPDVPSDEVPELVDLIWLNNEEYVRVSPAERVARIIYLYSQTQDNDGIFLDIHPTENDEYRLLFGVGNPPHSGFLAQLLEIFQRLNIRVRRSYCLTITNGIYPYFLSTFYVSPRDHQSFDQNSELYAELQREMYNTQILSSGSRSYWELLSTGMMTGTDTTLVEAMIGFCHTNLAHNAPDTYEPEGIMRAFHNHPDMTMQLLKLFHTRFDPDIEHRESLYEPLLKETKEAVDAFTTGRRILDGYRRTVFHCALTFIQHCLKTNFFVPEKHALAFRLDPGYLETLDEKFTSDLPVDRPFRITFFSGRRGLGYHMGFSDIARGGWRTLITQNRDDYTNSASTLFKENYVLAHTQHLKNKDIYEGGSKMVAILNIDPRSNAEQRQQYLYKLQFGFANAFLDLFVTENGVAKDPRVEDYYAQDEPIELGPDENMHNVMIELIAKQAVKRGYLLGSGIMSSKEVGINHKEYGVTSIGVMRFAEVTMQELGLDMHTQPFSVKFTGGPNGDVAGNGMRLLLERCPHVQIKLIIDGTGALFDPEGLDHEALAKVVLQDDLDGFDPCALHEGGFLLYRNQTRKEGIRNLFKKVTKVTTGLDEEWLSTDQFYKVYNSLAFSVDADLFIPAGGRPETIDASNVDKFVTDEGFPSARVIVEGANSYITPDARMALQKLGVVIMRDASANKCGVISSSYEIIANLMLTDEEFLDNKEQYVSDVIDILNRMAELEARAIFKRHRELGGALTYTEISNKISREINTHYTRMFDYFQCHAAVVDQPLQRNALIKHMPNIIQQDTSLHERIDRLPEKVKYAMLASQLASSMVYAGDDEHLYKDIIEIQLKRVAN